MNLFKCTTFTSSNLLNFILWGGLFLVGAGCSTGIIDSDEEDQTSGYNEPWPWREGVSDTTHQESEEDQTSDHSESGRENRFSDITTTKQTFEGLIKECYSTLGLEAGANEEAIQKAFKKLSRKNHPDKGGDKEYFQRISNIRDVLLAYCEYLSENGLEHGASNIDFEELMENSDIRQIKYYFDLGEST